ncbi:hypothetical protein JQC67_03330 [Aurantibacter crassamenti]|uniref:hypothetical protein n=1 Tax=Aurantibacter crassamenti TaxID=1837375 RepID=UPI001939E6AC|nr:hypothetical protein [Aurantibacter crassamenti]MBM1105165.1 hypothetical protein [Aurantibacter crassamenti]
MERFCKYCNEIFNPRRKNHIYCCSSCKTLASYKRNQYKYVSGHYQKNEIVPSEKINDSLIEQKNITASIPKVANDKNRVNFNSVANSVIGNLAADSLSYGLKKAFAPNSIPATKEDILALQKDINQLKLLLKVRTH